MKDTFKKQSVKLSVYQNYAELEHLSKEGREKLALIKPETLGQASRISGVNPSDIAILSFHMNEKNK